MRSYNAEAIARLVTPADSERNERGLVASKETLQTRQERDVHENPQKFINKTNGIISLCLLSCFAEKRRLPSLSVELSIVRIPLAHGNQQRPNVCGIHLPLKYTNMLEMKIINLLIINN